MKRIARPWAAWGLAVYAVAAGVVLLSPISPGAVVEQLTSWLQHGLGWSEVRQGWVEFAANVALFVPLGFLITALLRRAWIGFVLSLVLSAGAEAVQILLPARTASLRDILANVTGAAIGALIAWLVLRARRVRVATRTEG